MHRRVCRAKADLPAPRWAVVNGKLWLCGGRVRTAARDGTPTVVMYDSQNDTWATGSALPHAIKLCSGVVCDGEQGPRRRLHR